LVTLLKNCWPRELGSVVIQLYAGECTPSIDRDLALSVAALVKYFSAHYIFFFHFLFGFRFGILYVRANTTKQQKLVT